MRVIGIIGGMGPEATVLLMNRIIALTPARDDSDHVPMIVDNNTAIPSRIAHLIEKTGIDPGPTIAGMAAKLERHGADFLAMPCNTAHSYAEAITGAVTIPFLDMVALTVEAVRRRHPGVARVGLLGSPAIEITAIFDRAFAAAGIDVVYPPDRDALLGAIRAIKRGDQGAAATAPLRAAYAGLAEQGAGVAIVACSEFSLVADTLAGPLPVIDTVTILAEACVAAAGPATRPLAHAAG
ncbi:aspartate/glutamate racemase family protein [Acuticoccus kandeliae]|uniref:aspartate/glutamate racemase family protein n=1 Tax=Acuticoccus kandeliae TaxID=2073160 RepID=UPI000D3EC49B|nr:amino acid racemase [Acuticoccus kandeliae]